MTDDGPKPAANYIAAAGRFAPRALYNPAVALTMREGAFRPVVMGAVLRDGPADVLDVGCGTGTFLVALAARTGARLIGVDGDPEILRIAEAKAGRSAAGLEWLEGLADALPLADASVDVVATTLLLHHLDPQTKSRALAEMHRVLRPGGRLANTDWGAPHDPLMRIAFLALQLVDGFSTTRDHAAGRLPALIDEAGFADIAVEDHWRTVWGSLELLTARRPHTETSGVPA